MKKVFIAYANDAMAYSLKRIGRQARRLGIFDDVILYTPEDLPDYVKTCKLMQHTYGGGYWAWKPVVIYETLKKYEEGTIVCYVDAGCTLKKFAEWALYLELMKEHDFLCFKYRDTMPCWEKYGSSSTKIKYWTKKQSILFYDTLCGDEAWRENNKIWGGALFARGKQNPILLEWLDVVLNHPDIIVHPSSDEEQFPFFAQHKHDQPLLVALTHKYHQDAIVLPELSETCGKDVAIYASRIRAKNLADFIILRVKYLIRRYLGNHIVEFIKKNINLH